MTVSNTNPRVFAGVGSSTPPPRFAWSTGGGTGGAGTPIPAVTEPEGLTDWLATPEAQRWAGQWVLLSDDFEVLDSGPSPRALLDAHPEDRTPFIVYVGPVNRAQVV